MAAPTRTPRRRWIELGLRALAGGGPDAVRVEPLAKALGVTRGGFYWHFKDRGALLGELLDTWERMSTDEVIAMADKHFARLALQPRTRVPKAKSDPGQTIHRHLALLELKALDTPLGRRRRIRDIQEALDQ